MTTSTTDTSTSLMPTTRAVEHGRFVSLRGVPQWITIRGHDQENPALLILGGPGFALSPMAPLLAAWERRFTVVQWDQPGAGATYGRSGEIEPLTLDRITDDAIALLELLANHYGLERSIVLGWSAGSILGLRIATARPDLLAAYVGLGQVVHWARQDALSYRMLLDRARAEEDVEARVELEQLGPPPYPDAAADAIKSRHAARPTPAEQAAMDPASMAAVLSPPAGASYLAPGVELPEPYARSLAVYAALRPEIVAFDALALGRRLEVPLFFFQGEHDAFTVTSEVQTYAAAVEAPSKRVVLIEGAGHSALFVRHEVLAQLERHVRPVAMRSAAPASEGKPPRG